MQGTSALAMDFTVFVKMFSSSFIVSNSWTHGRLNIVELTYYLLTYFFIGVWIETGDTVSFVLF